MDGFKNIDFPISIEKEEIELKPLNNEQIHSLVELSYNKFFNKEELENLIISFSDRVPERIKYFVSEPCI